MRYSKLRFFFAISIFLGVSLSSCTDGNDDSMGARPTGRMEVINLSGGVLASIAGTVTFIELSDGSANVEILLENTPAGGNHPAFLRRNSAAAGGPVMVTLEPIDGNTGMSTTHIFELDNRLEIMYNDLINLDAHITVQLTSSMSSALLAQGDIGQNLLTGNQQEYPLQELSMTGGEGSVIFAERRNGTSLVMISISNSSTGLEHPAHIHENTVAVGGPVSISLSPVIGSTGISYSQVEKTDSGESLTYETLIEFDGYLDVHRSSTESEIILAQGNIGSNG